MSPHHDALQNPLLAVLPAEDFARLSPKLAPVTMPLVRCFTNQANKCGRSISRLMRLFHCATSWKTARRRKLPSSAMIGDEGRGGISWFMGGETTPSRAVVQSAGGAFRLKWESLKEEFSYFSGDRGSALHPLLLRYAQALLTQIAHTSACNRHHSLDQRFRRRLLLSLDRRHSNELIMTQELIANMLRVRREGVTEAA